MNKPRSNEVYVLDASDLGRLFRALQKDGRQIVGPTLSDGAIIYDRLDSVDDLPRGWTDRQEKGYYRLEQRQDKAYFAYNVGPHSWKKYLHPPQRQVFRVDKTAATLTFVAAKEQPEALAFIGVRSCELHAMAIQDQVFATGAHHNEDYKARRRHSFIVAVSCSTAAATCFCTSMDTGPEITLPCDLELTEIVAEREHFFLLRAGSSAGSKLLIKLSLTPASAAQCAEQKRNNAQVRQQLEAGSRAFDSADVQELLYRNYDSPVWQNIAERCLSCANCTMVCPTCFCSNDVDTTDISGQHAERWQHWDSCFHGDFTHVHGAGPVRDSTRSRYRQWMTHKLATWYEQFGSSGCVGCGRCISWCPVGIDITEEIDAIRSAEGAPSTDSSA